MIHFDDDALSDLERIFEFHLETSSHLALRELEKIRSAVSILDQHPRIGRLVRGEIRELIISVGKTGYVALYQHDELDGVVRVLGVSHQREAGYSGR